MNEQIRVNVTTTVNSSAICYEKRNGRDVIIVPSATMPDDIVMNGIKYPAAEIAKGFKSLERSPAPFGHPTVNGEFVSASDPEGLNIGWIGAWNENVRQKDGRVFLDKIIDVSRANESQRGRDVLAAIKAGGPIHTSTGLLCVLDGPDDDTHTSVARDIYFDHDAILLEEEGAATPDQGVGMMVNSKGEKLRVINSIYEEADREMDWAIESLARALDKQARLPMLERLKAAILGVIAPKQDETQTEKGDIEMTEEQFNALTDKVNALADAQAGISGVIADAVAGAIKPLTDQMAATALNAKMKEDEDLKVLREKIVNANIMGKEAADTLTMAAATELVAMATPKKAFALNSGYIASAEKVGGFTAPKGE